jgi:hypothetical protein
MSQSKKQWQGGDVLMDWHHTKTKTSESEALRNAEYCSPITQFKSDMYKSAEFLVVAGIYCVGVLGVMFMIYAVAMSVVK